MVTFSVPIAMGTDFCYNKIMVDFTTIHNQVPRGSFLEWIVLHKILLKRIFFYVLIVVSAGLWGYAFYGLADWLFISGPKERAAIARLHLNLVNYEVRQKVRSLEIRGVTVIPGVKYDTFGIIRNPNANWRAEFDYRFLLGGEETRLKSGFILPGEEKFIFDLGMAVKGKPVRGEITIENIRWSRVRKEEVPNYDEFKKARLAFSVGKIQYTPTLEVAERSVSRAEFTVTNNSAFSYFEVPLQVILYRGSSVAGINAATMTNFFSGETRSVDVTWFDALAGITRVEVKPDLNIFNPSIYIKR